VALSDGTVGDLPSEVPLPLPLPMPIAKGSEYDRSGQLVKRRILIVEDDLPLAKFLSRELNQKQFCVDVSHDGEGACEKLLQSSYDLIILDLNLPKMDGMAFLKHVRLDHLAIPILVLTARNRTEDLVATFEHGADDCLVKPFSVLELLVRVRSLLRRMSPHPVVFSNRHNLVINREEHRVLRGKRKIDLTPRELAILEYLVERIGRPVSRMDLMRDVWQMPFDPGTNIIDVYMKYLRDKIDFEGEEKLIRTIRGVGYVLSYD
jgi:DNA-binding response OmpR family regulator